MRTFTVFLSALLLITWGEPGLTDQPETPGSEQAGSEEAQPEDDWSQVREPRRAERLERGEVATVTFEGEFSSGGLPTEDTRAMPLGSFDLSFVLSVRVDEVLEANPYQDWPLSASLIGHTTKTTLQLHLELAAQRRNRWNSQKKLAIRSIGRGRMSFSSSATLWASLDGLRPRDRAGPEAVGS